MLGAAAGRRRVPPQRQEGPERTEGASFRFAGERDRVPVARLGPCFVGGVVFAP